MGTKVSTVGAEGVTRARDIEEFLDNVDARLKSPNTRNYERECEEAIHRGNASPWPRPVVTSPDARVGIGGAPTRATTLPDEANSRKQYPVASGLCDYFPDALVAVSHISWRGNQQHNPGQPLHWARSKSSDEANTMMRHFLQRGTLDTDGLRHTAKMAWRALALLQKEIEEEQRVAGPVVKWNSLSPSQLR